MSHGALLLAAALVLAAAAGVSGLVLLIFSNGMYYGRTLDKDYGRRFWLSKSIATRREYILNQIGFWLALSSILLLFAFLLVVRSGGS